MRMIALGRDETACNTSSSSTVAPYRGRVLFCANTAWSMYQFRRGVLTALIEEGYEVHVAAPIDQTTISLEQMGCVFHPLSMSTQGRNPLRDLQLAMALCKLYRRLRPRVVLHYTIKPNIYGSMAARVVGIQSIAVATGLGYVFINRSVVSQIGKLLYRISLRFSQQVWFLNRKDLDAFVSEGLVRPEKCEVLPGEGVDLKYYVAPVDAAEPVPGKFCFLLIARMLWDKGIGEYVEAARLLKTRYPYVRCQLMGSFARANPSAIPSEQIDAWVREGVIEYLGESHDVRPAIAAAQCIVLPSYREGIPRVLMEACAMQRPVIATAVPGCQDVVEDGHNGLVCRERDARDLADKMQNMIELDADAWRRMGVAGRVKMEADFDEQHVIDRYRKAINALA